MALTELEAIYRLTNIVRQHLLAHEDVSSPDLLLSDIAGGLRLELEQRIEEVHDAQR